MDSFIINLRDASDARLLSISDQCTRWLHDPRNLRAPRRAVIAGIAADALHVHNERALAAQDADDFTESAHQYGVSRFMETA